MPRLDYAGDFTIGGPRICASGRMPPPTHPKMMMTPTSAPSTILTRRMAQVEQAMSGKDAAIQ